MGLSVVFFRLFFTLLSAIFMTVYMLSTSSERSIIGALTGVGIGLFFGLFLIIFDVVFRRFNLRSLNVTILGIFVGYLMGKALLLLFGAILEISSFSINLHHQAIEMIKIGIFLFGVYFGTVITLRSNDELYVSIPFIRFTRTTQKKKISSPTAPSYPTHALSTSP